MVNNMDKRTQGVVFKSTGNLCVKYIHLIPHWGTRASLKTFDQKNPPKKQSASDQQACTAPRHGLQNNALIFPQVLLSAWTASVRGPLLSGVKGYSHSSYKIKSRPVASWNSKDLFACRKMTETFTSGNQQTAPFSFSNGPWGKHERNRFSERSARCQGLEAQRCLSPAITQLVARNIPL